MPKLQECTVYTPDNQVADLAESLGMRVHLITGPYHHVTLTPSTSLGRTRPYAT